MITIKSVWRGKSFLIKLIALVFALGLATAVQAQNPKIQPSSGSISTKVQRGGGTPGASTYWTGYWESVWTEECHIESRPGYTDRDWDDVEVCTWTEDLVWVDVWIDDPDPICPTSSPPTDIRSIVFGKQPMRSAASAITPSVMRSAPLLASDTTGVATRSQILPYRQMDFRSTSDRGFSAARTFVPQRATAGIVSRQNFGVGWFGKWDRTVSLIENGAKAIVTRGDGGNDVFTLAVDGSWKATGSRNAGVLVRLGDSDSNSGG